LFDRIQPRGLRSRSLLDGWVNWFQRAARPFSWELCPLFALNNFLFQLRPSCPRNQNHAKFLDDVIRHSQAQSFDAICSGEEIACRTGQPGPILVAAGTVAAALVVMFDFQSAAVLKATAAWLNSKDYRC
jgi:hypothetical protein